MTGRHRGQDSGPGTATLTQREMIAAWQAALALPDTGRHVLPGRRRAAVTSEALSERQAGDLLQSYWNASLTWRRTP